MTRQAGIYVRISLDLKDTRLGVARQRKECLAKAKARGWTVVEVFEDNNVSASSTKRRPEYERMLAAIRAGRINAVVAWDQDRLIRRPIEIEPFIDLADEYGVDLASVGGDTDLSTPGGRLYFRIKGAVARNEMEQKGARQQSANRQKREAGKPHGGRRTFGYTADGMVVVPEEADAIQRAAADLLAGASLYSIVRTLNEKGLPTTAGNPWTAIAVRRLLARPRLAGLVSYQGEIVGRGAWPAVLDEDTYRAVLGALAAPERHQAGRPRSYLASGIATCGICDAKLICGWEKAKGYAIYRCPSRRHVSRRGPDVDGLLTDVLLTRLSTPAVLELLTRPDDSSLAAELRREERSIRDRLNGLADAFAAGEIDRMQLARGTRTLNEQLAGVAAQLNTIVQRPGVAALLSADDIAAEWGEMEMDRRRAVARSLLAAVVVHSAGRGARRFDPATVQISWK